MKNKLSVGFLCSVCLIGLTGCGNSVKKENASSSQSTSTTESKTTVKSKCSYYKCLTKMSLENTIEELNDIVGFDATKVENASEGYDKYKYDFGNDKVITVSFYKQKLTTINMAYNKKELKNKKVTLDNLKEVKEKINDGITYDQFKDYVGGVEGTLYELGSWNKYVWVTEDGNSNVSASFSATNNKLTFFNGLGF